MNEDQESLPVPAPSTEPSPPVRLWPLWSLAVLLLILVLALGAGGWFLWQGQKGIAAQTRGLSQQLDSVDQQLGQRNNNLDQRLQQLQQSLDKQQGTLARHSREIDHNAQALLSAGHRSHTDWLLAEAEYLLRIANQRLQVEQDFHGALKLLQQADQVLSRTDDPGVFPVRKALAQEEMALRSVQDVDRTGLYLKLEAALHSIAAINEKALVKPIPAANQKAAKVAGKTKQNGAASPWQAIADSLERVIVIRRLDQPVKPLPDPTQSAYLRLDLRLRLQQAEIALLRGDSRVYQTALHSALHELQQWFDDSQPQVAALKSTIEALARQPINPKLPDISPSLRLLKARIAGRDEQAGSSSSPTSAPSDSARNGGKSEGGQ